MPTKHHNDRNNSTFILMKKIYATRILSFITCALLLTAVAINKNGKVAGYAIDKSAASNTQSAVIPNFSSESADTTTITSIGIADDVSGFAGATPVEIKIADGKIVQVNPLPNEETEDFFQSVVDDGLFKSWDGLTPKEALEKHVDAVSGATYSSSAVIKTVNLTLAKTVKDAQSVSPFKALLNWKFLITLLAIISAVALPFFSKSQLARTLQLIVNVAVIGLWSHCFISLSLIINCISNGFDIATGIIPALLLIVAFIFPLFGKSSHYCNYVCPFGSLQELAGKTNKRKIKLSAQVAKWLNYFRQALWVCMLVAMLLGAGFQLLDYEAFSAFMFNQASTAVIILACTFLVLSVFIPRPYCRFVCPTGSALKLAQHCK